MTERSASLQAAGRVALVTGASRGIGAATVISLAGAGYRVGVNYRTGEAEAAAVVARIRAAGGTAAAIQGDIAREEDVVRLFAEVDRALGPLSALVANAGISGGFGRIDDVTGDTLRAVFETNVYGTFWCCREAVRRLSTAHGGQGGGIVLVSSQAARFGGNRLGPYAASKAAINALTIGLAREVAAEGIRVNAVSPGVIETDQQSDIPADRRAALEASIPMGRLGTPEEVAETICWLLSDSSSYVSGSIIPVHGAR
ncbi:short-chain dehydrogenase [Skermanella aerolata]|uniref:Short-chain dehydrogenase n=1 Tax=Skermanella aerolata TaxID=393310 RepID=A0A512DPJ4_9PROT|nr:SDR family oxidoreductase [Skermanella aerolata]GEO38060.1 short-chain dehydrogenase [Skermanella aerolata]